MVDGDTMPYPAVDNDYLAIHTELLRSSLHNLTGRDLVDDEIDAATAAKAIFHAPFVVLSHNTEADPILTYANLAGLKLFELDWEKLVKTPSRFTASETLRDERAHLLQKVNEQGYIDDYAGVRVSSNGHRFRIEQATVWNLVDGLGMYCGQAATFSQWSALP